MKAVEATQIWGEWAGPSLSHSREHGVLRVVFGGNWRMNAQIPENSTLFATLAESETLSLDYATDELENWDTSLLALLVRLEHAARDRGLESKREALPEGLRRLLDMAFAVPPSEGAKKAASEENVFVRIGDALMRFPRVLEELAIFQGELVLALGRLLRGTSDMRLRDFIGIALDCSLHALPIIMLTSTLFGMILAFVGAVQLTQFGAQIYVAGLVGIAMLRVMGAVLVGVVMAGRTGASYAAIIGTMQVNEEVDALVTFGISPMDYLVLPRIIALVIMVPLLTLYADLMGIIGGFLVGVFMLGISPAEYYNATANMVALQHLFVGQVYALAFGAIVGFCGCYQGLRCGRSAEAVGQAATAAVVTAIVWIIIATAIITVICNVLNV